MYESFWGLHSAPFENVPDPRFFYAAPSHEECLARLSFAVNRHKGAALVVGDVGCGKTLVCRKFLGSLPPGSHDVALLVNPSLGPTAFLRELLRQWGEEPRSEDKAELLSQVRTRVLDNHGRGVESLVVIDEAQTIRQTETLEEIRLLLNFQRDDRFLLTVILLGQPELLPTIRALPQLSQRIPIRGQLGPLPWEEAVRYVLTRLQRAGGARCMFSPEAVREVYRRSGGVPRRINTLCDLALLQGYLDKATTVEARHVSDPESDELMACG